MCINGSLLNVEIQVNAQATDHYLQQLGKLIPQEPVGVGALVARQLLPVVAAPARHAARGRYHAIGSLSKCFFSRRLPCGRLAGHDVAQRSLVCVVVLPAGRQYVQHQHPHVSDGTVAAYYEIDLAQFLLHLPVSLLDQVAQAV